MEAQKWRCMTTYKAAVHTPGSNHSEHTQGIRTTRTKLRDLQLVFSVLHVSCRSGRRPAGLYPLQDTVCAGRQVVVGDVEGLKFGDGLLNSFDFIVDKCEFVPSLFQIVQFPLELVRVLAPTLNELPTLCTQSIVGTSVGLDVRLYDLDNRKIRFEQQLKPSLLKDHSIQPSRSTICGLAELSPPNCRKPSKEPTHLQVLQTLPKVILLQFEGVIPLDLPLRVTQPTYKVC